MIDLTYAVLVVVRARGPMRHADIRRELTLRGWAVRSEGGLSPDLDAALQRLRKAGKIASSPKGWTLADTRPCRRCGGSGREPQRKRT